MGADSLKTTTERERKGEEGDKWLVWTKLIRSTWRRAAVLEWQLSTWTTPSFLVTGFKCRMINCCVSPICWSGGCCSLCYSICCPCPRGAYLAWAAGDILFFQRTDLHLDLMFFFVFLGGWGCQPSRLGWWSPACLSNLLQVNQLSIKMHDWAGYSQSGNR